MMIYPALDDLMKKVDTRYTAVILAAKRARMLSEDPELSMSQRDTNKTLTTAVNEIAEDLITYTRD